MAPDRTLKRAADPIRKRPALAHTVQRSVAPVSQSPARALQERLGDRAAQALIARSIAPSIQMSQTTRLPAKVSKPTDPAELEAEETARKVTRMQDPPAAKPAATKTGGKGTIQRSEAAPSAAVSTTPHIGISGGSPLPSPVRSLMEPRFGASFGNVRIHTGEAAAQQSAALGANAFTVGEHVFFGRDKFQPQTSGGQELIAHELTHTIQQGAAVQRDIVHRSVDVAVAERVTPHIQRGFLGIPNPREYFANKAANVPGYTLLTVVIGFNPISGARVDRNAGNILRGAVQLMPGGKFVTDALDAHGVFDTVSAWVSTQFEALKDIGSTLQDDIGNFIKGALSGFPDFGALWDQAKAIVDRPIAKLKAFASGVKDGIVTLIKNAILKPIAAFARTTRGYPLLCTVMGKDPITGETVAQDPETLLGAFMKFIGEDELWATMQKARAIQRAFAWFKSALGALRGFISEIPGLFVQAFKSLDVMDIVLIPRAFLKLAHVFGGFAGRFVTWGATAVWTLLEIIFDVVSPGALAYIKKTGSALKSILRNPLPFVGNLVKAAKLGFTNFADHFLDHLKAGLIDWLTGSLPGIYIPKAFSLSEIAKFAFSVLGLTWANIRQKLVKATSETAVKAMETGFDIVVTLVREGPAAAWDKIKEQLANLKDMVIGGITDFVVDMVVKKAIPKLIAMFIPGAGFLSAILSIYDTVMVFVNKIKQIIQVVTGFIDSIVAIAAGQIGAAATRVENALAGVLSLAINFLAGFAGLGKVADKVMGVINKIRAPIDKALDWLVNWIVTAAKKLGKMVVQAGVPQDPNERLKLGKQAALAAVAKFAGRPVGASVLAPLLAAIKVRYGFARLEAVAQRGRWHVVGSINPNFDEATESLTPEGLAPGPGQQALAVGEGNFSFAVSITANVKLGGKLVATDYVANERLGLTKKISAKRRAEAEAEAQFQASNIAKLSAAGVEVERQVDSRDPANYPAGAFDVVVFNHPMVTTRVDGRTVRGGESANLQLITEFLAAAKQRIREGGKIIIISSLFRLQRWKLDKIAEQLNLEQKVLKFLASDFPGYIHQKTEGTGGAETVKAREQFAIVFTIKTNVGA